MTRFTRAALGMTIAAATILAPPALAQPGHDAPPVAVPAPTGAATHDAPHVDDHGKLIEASPEWLKQGVPAMIAALVVFGTVYFVLKAKAWPKIVQGLQARADKIRTEIEGAELAQRQAKSALDQYEKNLADARAEAQKMLSDAMAQQQAIAAELKAKAEIELGAMRDRARRDIEAAKRAALSEIYDEVSSFSANIAGKILKREITAGDQQRLVEESLTELQGMSKN